MQNDLSHGEKGHYVSGMRLSHLSEAVTPSKLTVLQELAPLRLRRIAGCRVSSG